MKFTTAFVATIGLLSAASGGVNAIDLCSLKMEDGNCVPTRFACTARTGDEVNPPLKWSGVAGAQSYIHLFDDPDANYYLHWMVTDIPSNTLKIDEAASQANTVPGTQLKNYRGNCPGQTNNYRYTIFAMKTATANFALGNKRGNVVEQELIATGNVLEQKSIRAKFNGSNGGANNNCPLVNVPCTAGDIAPTPAQTPTPAPTPAPTPSPTPTPSVTPTPTRISCSSLANTMTCSSNGQFVGALACPVPCSTQTEFDTACCAYTEGEADASIKTGGSPINSGGGANGAASSVVPTVVAAVVAIATAMLL